MGANRTKKRTLSIKTDTQTIKYVGNIDELYDQLESVEGAEPFCKEVKLGKYKYFPGGVMFYAMYPHRNLDMGVTDDGEQLYSMPLGRSVYNLIKYAEFVHKTPNGEPAVMLVDASEEEIASYNMKSNIDPLF